MAAMPASAKKLIERTGARRIRVEIPDTDGNLRGKYVDAGKLAKGKGTTLSDVFYVLSIQDDVFDAPITSPETGFPDMVAMPDWSTLVEIPWEAGVLAVICDVFGKDGEPFPVDVRRPLRLAQERMTADGFDGLFGVEFEVFLFHDSPAGDEALRASRPRDLVPVGREWQAYSLFRFADHGTFAHDLIEKLAGYGVHLEAFSTELGYGMVEASLAAATPLAAADQAARFKLAAKEIARRHGMLISFIAKWDTAQSGSSGHLHQSLSVNGENTFRSGPGELSDIGRHYLGGLVATAREVSAFMSPFPNSYRRYVPDTWAPPNPSWGHDNRNACFRVITLDASSARIEHRRPGADLNPYLSIAACLDGGLHGVRERIEPPEESPGRAYLDDRLEPFPADVRAAAAALRASSLARTWYGDALVDHYAVSREAEAGYWEAIRDRQVPDWEVRRYLETV